jgi:CDP-diacylglycerol--glycerol-3-phosphate 3-phosphatidyltransferase
MSPVFWPLALTASRLVLGPVLLLVAWRHPEPGPWLAVGVVVGFLTDLFDGIVARRLGVSTPNLRRFDSQTDLVFWLCVLGCVFVARPAIAAAQWGYPAGILALEAAIYVISIRKFGREACTHAYSAKAWAVLAVGVFVAVLGFGEADYALPVLFITYAVSWLDVVAIILILPEWRSDVPSFYHARLVRRGVPFRTFKFFH